MSGAKLKALRKQTKSYISLAVMALVLSACLGDPYSGSYTNRRPHESDLVGTWVPNQNTLRDMRNRGRYPIEQGRTSLILRADGKFEMLDMPDWWRDPFGRPHGHLESSSGTWKLKENSTGPVWEIELQFPTWWTTTALRNEKPPYFIHFTIGDPDNGEAMTFIRKSENSLPSSH